MIRTKRMAAVLAAALLLSLALAGCAAEPKKPDENEIQLQAQWSACLEASDRIYADMCWAFAYAEAFSREPSWDNLQKARAACSSVISSMYAMELPENTMSQEQLTALMDKGVDADVVVTELENLPTQLNNRLTTMQCLLYLLRDDVYLTPSAEKIGSWVKTNQDGAGLQCEYLAVTTNYLLLQMEDRSLWDTMADRFSAIGPFCGHWEADPKALETEADRVLDEMESQLAAESGYLGISEYTLELVRGAVETGDLQPLADALYPIEGVPAWFPMPEWLPQDLLWYYLMEEDGELRLLNTGEALDQAPAACYIPCDGITREDMRSYAARLEFWGTDHYVQEENDTCQILVDGGECKMLVTWTQEETLLFLTDGIGCLMPELYLGAMWME